MRLLVFVRLPLTVCVFGAFLLLSPACRAQEVNPDHFDGPNTEPLDAPAKSAQPKTPNGHKSISAHSRRSKPASSLQLATAQNDPQPLSGKDAVRVPNETTPPTHEPKER